MRSPAEYLVRGMICQGQESAPIADTLSNMGIIAPDMDEFVNIRTRLGTIPPMVPPYTGALKDWLAQQGIYTFIAKREAMQRADMLLNTPGPREEVERLLLTDIDLSELLSYLRKKPWFQSFTVKDLKLFKHYYWNMDLLTPSQRARYLSRHEGSDRYTEMLYGGRTSAMWRMGIDSPMTDDELHRQVYRQLAVRVMVLGEYPFNAATNIQVAKLASVLSRMWKDMKVAGAVGLEATVASMSKFVEERRAPRIAEVSSNRYLTPDEGEEDDDFMETPDSPDTGTVN